MRTIDADNVLKALGIFNDREHGDPHFLNGIETAREIVEQAPTVDAEPVRHGTWDRKSCVNGKQYDPTTDYWAYAHRCSECDKVSYFPNDIPDKWCRHCGAKMDGDGNAR